MVSRFRATSGSSVSPALPSVGRRSCRWSMRLAAMTLMTVRTARTTDRTTAQLCLIETARYACSAAVEAYAAASRHHTFGGARIRLLSLGHAALRRFGSTIGYKGWPLGRPISTALRATVIMISSLLTRRRAVRRC